MRRTGKLVTIIILLAAAGFVFYYGWIQFRIEPDSCGVLISKTNGINEKPVTPGKFSWHWETLLPTNAQLRVFSLTPYAVTKTVSGTLPSSDVYSQLIKQNADFSYSFRFDMAVRYTPDGVVAQVKSVNAKSASDLNAGLDKAADAAARRAADWILEKLFTDPQYRPSSVSSPELLAAVSAGTDSKLIEFSSFTVSSASFPDVYLYKQAQKSYDTYHDKIDALLAQQAVRDAAEIADDSREITKLSKLVEVLRKYPELSDLLKSGSASETLKAVRTLQ